MKNSRVPFSKQHCWIFALYEINFFQIRKKSNHYYRWLWGNYQTDVSSAFSDGSVDVDELAPGSLHALDTRSSDLSPVSPCYSAVTRLPLIPQWPVISVLSVNWRNFHHCLYEHHPCFLSPSHSREIDKNIVASNKLTLKFHSKTAN